MNDFRERINRVNEEVSWSDLGFNKEKGTVNCPFCGKKGKAYLYPKFFKCFSSRCGVTGDKLHIHQKMNNLNFIQALTSLETKACVDPKQQQEEYIKRDEILNHVLDAYHDQLYLPNNEKALTYLYQRGFTDEFIKTMRIGYAPSSGSVLSLYPDININKLIRHHLATPKHEFFWNRIIFPIHNTQGYLVHLTGRKFPNDGNDDMKWLDSKSVPLVGSSKNYLLFENQLECYKNRGEDLYLVEGVPDAFIMKQMGYPVLGVLGLQKLLQQASKIDSYGFKNIIAIFDNDRYEINHPNYPGELKSWRVVTNQLIDLQLYLGRKSMIDVCMIPEDYEDVKDINDLYIKTNNKSAVDCVLNSNKESLVNSIIRQYGGDMSMHKLLLKLIAATGCNQELLQPYIPEDYDCLTYALKVLTT